MYSVFQDCSVEVDKWHRTVKFYRIFDAKGEYTFYEDTIVKQNHCQYKLTVVSIYPRWRRNSIILL